MRPFTETNDITMPELTAELVAATGTKADPALLSRWLIRNGYRFKKTLLASEQDRPDISQAREQWTATRQPKMRLEPHRLVFIDETGTTTKMTRSRGRCLKGQRLHSNAPFGHWKCASCHLGGAGGVMGGSKATNPQFNTKNIENAVSVTCLDGFVDVQCGGKSARIGKNQQILYSRSGLGPSVGVEPGEVTAWQSGLLIFRDRPLASVIDEVNRYRAGKIVVISPELKQRTVSGDFEIDRLDTFVTQVQQLFGAHATSLLGGLVILS